MNKKDLFLPALVVFSASLLPGVGQAEEVPGTNLDVQFQSGHIVGSGRKINMLRIPVTDTTNNQTTFFDASFSFNFVPGQGFVFEGLTAGLSQPVATSNIRSGKYLDTVSWCYQIDGPSLLPDGRSFYSIRAGGEGCPNNNGFSANFTTGPATGHPDIGGRSIVTSLNNSWEYGIVSNTTSNSSGFRVWPANGLIGVRQNGDQITFALFDLNGGDTAEPQQSSVLSRISE
ncbi:MAG: hypothetical protein RQ714_04620 [Nitrosomonas sp.]|nr:hypothetical protein [Nitrosomonas sp.]